MGMRPEEFWDMTPFEWNCKCQGFQHKKEQVAIYVRETWAMILHAGGYRSEDDQPIRGEDLLKLPSEKKRRKRPASSPLNPLLSMSEAERNDLRERINRSAPTLD